MILDPASLVDLQKKLDRLKKEHTALEQKINSLRQDSTSNDFQIHRLKKEKLHIKDQIAKVDALLTPDIIA